MARICRLMEKTWERSEVNQRAEVLASFLASRPRYSTDAVARKTLTHKLEIVRESLEDDSLDVARRCLEDLEDEAAEWADHPHYPAAPRAHEADAQVRDYVKDELRSRLSTKQRGDRDVLRGSIEYTRRRLLFNTPNLTMFDRLDVHYISGRALMALDLGHLYMAGRERERLREIAKRYEA
ncbi:hypothetical protein J1792_09110 [Streptomyces triculaminicus]|uniref:Uncharacterized protein n=1 Tax=Streptomyces triculaminicus TaxID=2816232 RepID=A0A939FK25_9ACTN|nr:hypothetical protein [Streptomyces triculaminicus]MBO0652943.1 hypothetical protein [Streptomyces triculaminicus]